MDSNSEWFFETDSVPTSSHRGQRGVKVLAKVELSAAFLALAVSNLNFKEKNDYKSDCLMIKLLTRDFKVHMAL